ncbi:MAG: protoporphyrinogen oxidase [Nocardioides sp.]|nr:protoporphyrinogen oxidase [Nocardioides sp.]
MPGQRNARTPTWEAGHVKRIAVVGGGVAGLTAARDLVRAGHHVVVLEASPHLGGKLLRTEVAGVVVDVGAEAMLARRPEGLALAASLGLNVVHPAVQSSRIWTRGAVRPLPRSLMGVPMDVEQLAASGVLSDAGLARVRAEPGLPVTAFGDDISVGDLVAQRLGDEVTDRLVEPLLGGVYAGRARDISARAAMPQLVALAERGSLLEAAAALPDPGGPVFGGLAGGMAGLADALADSVITAGGEIRLGATVRALRREGAAYVLEVGPSTGVEALTVDAVVLATPAAASARLLAVLSPAAATALGGIDHASMAIVTLAFRATDLPDLAHAGSGFLVPPVDGRRIKAATLSFAKWAWVREAGRTPGGDDVLLLRASLGRHGEEATLQRTDDELVAATLADLEDALGIRARPVDHHVHRWGGGLPQYALGHLDRVAGIRTALVDLPGLAVCGAAYDGVGIPAVIASAHRAATEIAEIAEIKA